MSSSIIKCLHLSDFHVGKDNYGQIQLFDSILEHIKETVNPISDLEMIFITGDIANRGEKSEYDSFVELFILPLSDILKDPTKIFIVPGNHDVNRSEARAVRRYNVTEDIPEFFDPDETGQKERKLLFPRFKNYIDGDFHEFVIEEEEWIYSEKGIFTHVHEKNGYSIGIIGINTAWLSESDEDKQKLSPGKALVENGLKEIHDCNLKIVLGHHPLNWFDEDFTSIKSLFGKNNVIYLHGHLHKINTSQEYGAGQQFLTLQTGAAFQARENEKWTNRLLWFELDLDNNFLKVEPRQWSKQNQEWALEGGAFPEIYRETGTDFWKLPITQPKKKL
ncbi:hypothetical protein DENIS_3842 [Desulfonema ishimotonii]|uniref:Calcineurin-like phosphoesterase domain-containing protein n=1 Tax=Desulfonema ishimotonii TaxID=45657 RepID=A0A401G0V0_9BACT|nr:metallophosphoesterase [Desulfonema ishimotonii]GBC62858.1 hypothetical protein DENIS_3842 [Desulfonema ishimotonii]